MRAVRSTPGPKAQGSFLRVPLSEWPRQKGKKAPVPTHRAHRDEVGSPTKPPRSGPLKGWPDRPRVRLMGVASL